MAIRLGEHFYLPRNFGYEEEVAISYPNGEPVVFDGGHINSVLGPSGQFNGDPRFSPQHFPNGYRGYIDLNHLELATPESSGLQSVAARIRAIEEFEVEIAREFLVRYPDKSIDHLRLLRRNIDADFNTSQKPQTWASHENYDVPIHFTDNFKLEDPNIYHSDELLLYLATRSIIVGAGYVDEGGRCHLSQKAVKVEQEYGRVMSSDAEGYRIETNSFHDDSRARFEVRCGDTNINDWANIVKFGGFAFLVAALQDDSNLFKGLDIDATADINQFFRNFQYVELKPDNTFANPSEELWIALELQRRIANYAINLCLKYEDLIPEEYLFAAIGIINYLDEFEKVLKGESIKILAPYSDWALKFTAINRGLNRASKKARKSEEKKARLAREIDLLHGSIIVRRDSTDKGLGFRARDKRLNAALISDDTIKLAMEQPDPNTRSLGRGALMIPGALRDGYHIRSVTWDTVELYDEDKKEYLFIQSDPGENSVPYRFLKPEIAQAVQARKESL